MILHLAWCIPLLLVSLYTRLCYSEREHKVHNIVLYPDRHSWCQTTAIKQIVASPGYKPVTIDNNVCVGACYSYSIPKTQPAEPGELIGPYCDSCKPADTMCYHVTLRDDKNSSKTIQKRVQIITNCSCSSCEKTPVKDCEITNQDTAELPSDLFSILHPHNSNAESKSVHEVPELLQLHPENHTSYNISNMTPEQRFEINAKIMNILSTIQNEDEDSQKLEYDKDQLRELLQIVEGSHHKVNDKNLADFMNFVKVHNNEEDPQLGFGKLSEVLEIFKKSENLAERHRHFGLGLKVPLQDSQKSNEDIQRDIENFNRKLGGSLDTNSFGIEGSHYGMNPHYKGSHIGMGLHPRVVGGASKNLLDDADAKKLEEPKKHHHHHVGEEQILGIDRGHLVAGPHGSLAFAPDVKIEEKLNLESHLVKPNHEGTVIEYENHPKRRRRRTTKK